MSLIQAVLLGLAMLSFLVAVLVIRVAIRKVWTPALTFPYVLTLLEEEQLTVSMHKHPFPHMEMFGLNNSYIFIEYVRVNQNAGLDEILTVGSFGFRDILRVDFHDQNIVRIGDRMVDPSKPKINCSAMYALRTMAEKICQEYAKA